MTDTEAKVAAAWKQAAADLGIQFTSPFVFTGPDGSGHEYLGLVHQFGQRIGAVISVVDEPSMRLPNPQGDDYFWSVLGPAYLNYERQLFVDTLNDWQFSGSAADRPSWYSGTSWT
jgi:hypothetical protein